MTGIKFEVGKKYKFHDSPGWAKLLLCSEDARPSDKLIFVRNNGAIITRCISGACYENSYSDYDITLEEYVEPFEPKIGRWKMRDGRTALVLYYSLRDSIRREPIYCLVGHIENTTMSLTWTKDGRFAVSLEDNSRDLIEYLGPLEPHETNWQEFLKKAGRV